MPARSFLQQKGSVRRTGTISFARAVAVLVSVWAAAGDLQSHGNKMCLFSALCLFNLLL